MEPFIIAASSVKDAQTAFFFEMDESKTNFSIHFTTHKINDEKENLQNWHKIRFNKDVIQILQTHGRLPINAPEKALKLCDENKIMKKTIQSV